MVGDVACLAVFGAVLCALVADKAVPQRPRLSEGNSECNSDFVPKNLQSNSFTVRVLLSHRTSTQKRRVGIEFFRHIRHRPLKHVANYGYSIALSPYKPTGLCKHSDVVFKYDTSHKDGIFVSDHSTIYLEECWRCHCLIVYCSSLRPTEPRKRFVFCKHLSKFPCERKNYKR